MTMSKNMLMSYLLLLIDPMARQRRTPLEPTANVDPGGSLLPV
jgi:hypothetical protein